jgi:hypothetical protein
MEKYLREWRQDAVNKHQYDTAIFVADKLLAITGASPTDTTKRDLDAYSC